MQRIPFLEIQKRFRQYGPDYPAGIRRDFGDLSYASVPILPRIVFVFHPDHIHEVLVHSAAQVEKPRLLRAVLRSSFGNGLFSSGGAFWRRQRKLMQPVFHHARLGHFAERMVAHTVQRVSNWRDGASLVIDAEMHALTLTIAVDALFSTDVSGKTDEIGQAMHDLGRAIGAQGNSVPLALMPDWVPLPILRLKQRAVGSINRLIYQMVNERRAGGEAASPPDLLSMLIFTQDADTGERMDDQQIRDEIMTLFIAGHETTALLLGWSWVLLAKHPEKEARLIEELQTVLGSRPPTLADLPRLSYTGQIIKEALRLYPPAWFLMRETLESITLDGETIPAKTIVFLFPYSTQRDERWFSQAEDFLPERWENDFERTLPKGAYFPFGMGPRVCIGNGFALMEAQLLLATIAQRFQIELLTQARPVKAIGTLGFDQPVTVRLHQRTS